MRAIVFEEFGGPEVLKAVDVTAPEPGPGEITIAVAYAGVNFADIKARADGYRVDALPFRPGLEVSGRIRAVGADVTGFTPGQEVAAFLSGGGYAETVLAPAAAVFAIPDGLSLRTGATLPSVLPTAYALLHEVARLREGDTVLVQGAAGGVGTVAGQLARMGGASAVYGVVSSFDKAEHALKSGYDQVFLADTFDRDVRRVTGGRGVDIALDPVGGETFQRTLAVLGRFGRLVSFGNTGSDAPWQIGPDDTYPLGASVAGFSLLTMAAADPQRLRELAEKAFGAVTEGGVELPVSAEFELADAASAHRLVESRTSTGKLLLRI
ncbi:NADPH2:quinone reductase [Streptomyces sp. DvalAA-14]|uniref:quinone oxidoreductase family protein n=1 Tax=unclassified Streptomyces TaxID=2593676 RepID=UPI00081B8E7D|nr:MULTISPECIES: zinc-binding dehydrogenase [unclassified Streptomyces]MYS20100.1 zinc-binding dehydrogenase [Streptomyces sp. SID4948]SCD60858.1 NADPH2:quinone reductase [Streptomyces sp. DvalAA-14]